jgi:hypothetical protein
VKVHPGHSVREEPNSLAKSCEDSEDTQPYEVSLFILAQGSGASALWQAPHRSMEQTVCIVSGQFGRHMERQWCKCTLRVSYRNSVVPRAAWFAHFGSMSSAWPHGPMAAMAHGDIDVRAC